MRILTISIESKILIKQLQFYDNYDYIVVMLVTFRDGKEVKRQELGKIIDDPTIKLIRGNNKFQRLAEILQKAKNEPLSRQLEEFRTAIRLDVPIWVLKGLEELIENNLIKKQA